MQNFKIASPKLIKTHFFYFLPRLPELLFFPRDVPGDSGKQTKETTPFKAGRKSRRRLS